jgi:hypothetical protein
MTTSSSELEADALFLDSFAGVGERRDGFGAVVGLGVAAGFGVKKLEIDCCFFAWDDVGCDEPLDGAIVASGWRGGVMRRGESPRLRFGQSDAMAVVTPASSRDQTNWTSEIKSSNHKLV